MSKGSIQRILHARVPILKFVDRKTGTCVQLFLYPRFSALLFLVLAAAALLSAFIVLHRCKTGCETDQTLLSHALFLGSSAACCWQLLC